MDRCRFASRILRASDCFGRSSLWRTSLVRVFVILGCALLVLGTRNGWAPPLGRTLVHQGSIVASDALLIDDFELDYSLFDRAGQLQRRGLATRVLVPVASGADAARPSPYAVPIVETMNKMAHLENVELIPYTEEEPISLNMAKELLPYLRQTQTRSVIVISPGFRSKRSYRVYDSVFRPAGIEVSCEPVLRKTTPQNWIKSWHGVQDFTLQFGKLWYYRLVVGI